VTLGLAGRPNSDALRLYDHVLTSPLRARYRLVMPRIPDRRHVVLWLWFAVALFVLVIVAASYSPIAVADRDCSDFPNQAAAQAYYIARGGPQYDPDHLDSDHDGVACESRPCPCSSSTTPRQPPTNTTTAPPPTTPTSPTTTTTQPTTTTTKTTGTQSTPASGAAPRQGRVVRVVDGDTIDVQTGAARVRVRLLGVDSPESVRPGVPAECGARSAARFLRALALHRRVRLAYDPSQGRSDRYGRLLAYVRPKGPKNSRPLLQISLLRAGWARVYVYRGRRFQRYAEFARAERLARAKRRGVWGVCKGNFHSASGRAS